MGSSGGGGGYNPLAFGAASPMPGLPIAGANSTIGDPYEYGKFQNFLPDIKAEGRNDMATGLRPEMFNYTKPNPGGGVLPGNTLSSANDIQGLRDQLAALQSQVNSGGGSGGGNGQFGAARSGSGGSGGWSVDNNTQLITAGG